MEDCMLIPAAVDIATFVVCVEFNEVAKTDKWLQMNANSSSTHA